MTSPDQTHLLRVQYSRCPLGDTLDSDARDRLMGHRPKDTKSLAYQVNQLAYLYEEISKLPAILPLGPNVPRTTSTRETKTKG